jgi:hypothetical protein
MGLLLAATISCLVAYPGCESPTERAQPDPVPTVAQFSISYHRSGGLKADPVSLRIAPGRQATAKRFGDTAHFRVGARRVRRLRGALERADFNSITAPEPNPGRCADCFYYDIAYRGNEVEFSQVDQPRGLGPVVEQLEALVRSHLPFH